MHGRDGGGVWTTVRGLFCGLFAAVVLGVLAAPASAAAPVCADVTLDDVHSGNSVQGVSRCTPAEGDTLSYAVTTDPLHGFGGVDFSSGDLNYFATGGYKGPDQFTVTATSGADGTSDDFVVRVTLTNVAPVCEDVDLGDISHRASFGRFGSTDCSDLDLDFESAWEIVEQPAQGTADIDFGTISYVPEAGQTGPQTFSYRVSDGIDWSAPADVTVNVTNSAPDCPSVLSFTIRRDKPASAPVSCFDADGDPLTLTVLDPPSHGTFTTAQDDGVLVGTYDPDDGYRGADSFRGRVSDGVADSDAFDVELTITRNHAPQCSAQTEHTLVGTAHDLFPEFLCFDQDYQDQASMTVGLDPAAAPEHGTATATADGATVTYTPEAGFTGRDEVGLRATDGELTTFFSAPVHVADTAFCSPAPTLRIRPGVTRMLTPDCTAPSFAWGPVELVSPPSKGNLTTTFGSFTYTAGSGATGPDSFTFKTPSPAGESPVATQAIEIDAAANEPPTCEEPFGALIAYSGHEEHLFPDCFDTDFDPLTLQISAAPAHGTAAIAQNAVRYTPAAGYTGPDSLDVRVSDGHGGIVTLTLPIDVRAPQAPGCSPVAELGVRPGGVRTVQVHCTNPQGDAQSYAVVEQPGKGTVADLGSGSYRYTAASGSSGADSFDVRVSNPAGQTTVTVPVAIDEAWNTAPTCTFSSVTVARGTTTDLPLASRCTDAEGDAMTFTRVSDTQNGTVTQGPAAVLQYAANDSFVGFDSFSYEATDSRGAASQTAGMGISVVATLVPSCTEKAAVSLRPGQSRSIFLECSSPTFGQLTYEIVTGPAKGTLQPAGDSTSASRTYTAGQGASGGDSFTYRARNSSGVSSTYTQSFTISPSANALPSCSPNSFFPITIVRDQGRAVTPPCSDADGDALSYQHVTQPQNGTVTTTGGVMTYTPAAGYTGPDQFTYTANDGHGGITSPVALHLQVNAPTPPTCQTPAPMSVRTNSPPRFVQIPCQDPQASLVTIVIEQEPEHGVVTEGFGAYYYEPDTDYEGADSFRYHAVNAAGSSNSVTQSITVDPEANREPGCFPFPLKVKPGRSRVVPPFCGDDDGDPLTYELTTAPVNGEVTPVSGSGPFTYTADETFQGADPFTMTADDGHGGTRTFTVEVTVSEENSPPTCFSGGTFTAQSGVATPLPAAPCSDPDGDPLTFEIVGDPEHGAITDNAQDMRVYTSDAGYVGPDSFTYKANDGAADSNVATANVNVINAPGPACQPRSYSVPTDGTLDVDLDCFMSGENVVLAIQDPPPSTAGTLGTVDQAADSVRFTPTEGFRGTTSFTFVGSAAGKTSSPTTIQITVTGRGFSPQVSLTTSTFSPKTGSPVTFTASAFDPDGGAIADYDWSVDGTAVPSAAGTNQLQRTFATAGPHEVQVEVTDDEGDVTTRTLTVTAHEGNLDPEVWLSAPPKAGTGVTVPLNAYAYDPDGSIAGYSWDFGDGTPVQSGATLDAVEHAYATPGSKTLTLTVTDNDGGSTTETATIVVTDENTAPALDLYHWPNPAQRNQPLELFAEATDEEGDAIVAYDWDLDGDGTFETDGGDDPSRTHTFTTLGERVVGVRAEDARGRIATRTATIRVVNAPPKPVIAGPGVLDLGTTGTYSSAGSTDDGSIVSRAWDTDDDGAFDDGTGTTATVAAGSTTGFKTIRVRVTDNEGETAVASRQITVRPAGPIVISDPVAPTQPDGGSVSIGTTTDPTSGLTTITIPIGQVSEFPGRCMPLDVNVMIRKAAGATVLNPTLVLTVDGGGVERFPMTDTDGDGVWTAELDCAVPGTMRVEYTIRAPDGSEEDFDIPAGKIVLIDPQGVVHDRSAFEAYRAANPAATADEARAATAVAGATVHLQRQVAGEWRDVNASDPGIDPNENPQVTGANGLYRWDVIDGTYRVRVSAPGFRSKTSDPVVIPPPVLDLHIGLDRNPPPAAGIAAADEAFRGQTVSFESDSDDDREIVAHKWDLDDDGDFDDATTESTSQTFTSLGAKTVRLQVTDDEGEKSVAETVVTIVNRAPTVSVTDGPATGFRGQTLTFTAQGSDADPGAAAPTFTWDTDGDGAFDDGTGASRTAQFATLGEQTVRVKATDADGGSSTAQRSVTIVNRAPTVSVTGGPATGFRGQALTFTAEGADADPGAAAPTLTWDTDGDGFDDGTGTSKSVAFDSLGAKTVRVRAADADGGSAEAQRSATIVNRDPTATATGPATGLRGQTLTFTATGADADPGAAAPALAWDTDNDGQFDDGSGASQTASFTGALGDRIVRVRATDADGGTATAQHTVTLQNRNPTASIAKSPAEPVDGDTVTFTATAGDADPGAAAPALAWDLDGDGFDDGTGTTASKAFPAGSHTVRLRATDADGGSVIAQLPFTVKAKPSDGGTGGGGGDTGGGDGGGGNTGGGGGDTGGGGPAPDTKAPAAGMTVAKGQKLGTVLSKGLKLALTLDEACTVKVTLSVDKATARKLKLDKKAKKAVVVGTLTKAVGSGPSSVVVKLTAKARKALKKARSVKLALALEAKDAAGNVGTKTGSTTLKR